MLVIGEWLICEDGVIRPTLAGVVRTSDGQMVDVPFLLDAGADRTVFSADFLDLLVPLQNTEVDQIRLAGVGGSVSSITIETAIGFIRDDGRVATVRGQFGVFTEGESAELSVLGRDVTNNFAVIYDYPNRAVVLLALPHYYEIKRPS
ncbi:MAG: hypothetical protein AABO57_15540 [Acidobacteriota bacterium]